MSQLGSITAEKEKQMDLERQRFQEVKAKMLAPKKSCRTWSPHSNPAGFFIIFSLQLFSDLYRSHLTVISLHFFPM